MYFVVRSFVCLVVPLYPINVKTAEPNEAKFCVRKKNPPKFESNVNGRLSDNS